jgi:hypothetical protein
MAYPTYHCSAASRCSFCHTAFLPISLALSVLLRFILCAPCPFTAQFLFRSIQLLHNLPSSRMNHFPHQQTPPLEQQQQQHPISSLYHVFIASVHLVHAVFAMPLHADSAPLSSTSRVLCLIIIVILQLLWWFTPRVQHHCMLY